MAFTVTATQSGSSANRGVYLLVRVLTGATEAGGASGGSNSLSGATAQGSLTPNFSSSWVAFSITADGIFSGAMPAAAAGNTYDANTLDNTDTWAAAQGHYSGTVTGGTPLTYGAGSAAGDHSNWCAYEIPASGSVTVDGSSPALASTESAAAVTTASFTPPAGSVLAAMVAAGGTGTGTGITVTMTDTSGLGLTWTRRAISSTSDNFQPAYIFTATVPSAASPSVQARPGQTWRRQFKHRQTYPCPQNISAAPIALSDSGTGTDTFSAGNVSVPLPALAGRTWRRQYDHRQAPLYTSTFSTDLSDSGTGSDVLAPGIATAYPFPPAVPGQTWLRQFKHRQQPVYTSTFSENFSDSGSGTDTLAPGIATTYPFPPAVPGRTWQRQFKHIQQALYTSTFSKDLADSGAGTDALTPGQVFSNPLFPATPGKTWQRRFKHVQTFPYLPVPANTFNIGLADSGAGTDTFSASISTTLPLTLRTGKTWLRQFKHPQVPLYTSTFSEDFSDSGAGTDALAITSGVPLSDSGIGTDALTPGILNPPLPAVFGKTWLRQFKHRQTPLYTSTFSENLADSGAGTDVLGVTVTAVFPIPVYSKPGKTWLRRYKHRQIPLYTLAYSINPARQAVFAAGQITTDWQLGLISTDWQTGQASTDWQLGLVTSR